VTVELRADEPVTAGVLSTVTGDTGQLSEIAYAAAAEPATPDRPAVVADLWQGENRTSTVYLTAPDAPVVADITPLPPAVGPSRQVSIAAGSQVPVPAADLGTEETFAVVVTPRSGRLLVVRQVDETEERGPFVTSTPVPPGRYVVPVPRVVADLSTGLRAGG
jgi:hypothetical protein